MISKYCINELTGRLHSRYVKESESGIGVGNFAKCGIGVGHFTSDSVTLVRMKLCFLFLPNEIYAML